MKRLEMIALLLLGCFLAQAGAKPFVVSTKALTFQVGKTKITAHGAQTHFELDQFQCWKSQAEHLKRYLMDLKKRKIKNPYTKMEITLLDFEEKNLPEAAIAINEDHSLVKILVTKTVPSQGGMLCMILSDRKLSENLDGPILARNLELKKLAHAQREVEKELRSLNPHAKVSVQETRSKYVAESPPKAGDRKPATQSKGVK